jgi:site-specific DNA-adenine methylase
MVPSAMTTISLFIGSAAVAFYLAQRGSIAKLIFAIAIYSVFDWIGAKAKFLLY